MGSDEQEQSDQAMLRRVRVVSFTATPTNIHPFERSTLTWEVKAPVTRPPIRITLGGGSITVNGAQGTRAVSPIQTTGYSLTASKGGLSRRLQSEHVFVGTTGCITQIIGEDQVREEVDAAIEPILAKHEELSRRRADRVDIEHDGLHISIRMKADIPNVADPDVDVDAIVSFRAQAGKLRWRFERYSFEVDFPWWQDAVNGFALPVWLLIALEEGNQASLVRTELADGLNAFVEKHTATAESAGLVFASVVSMSGRFQVTLCPKPNPSVFLAPNNEALAPN